ncbi:MAG TPA: DinB family protein [Longimicrobiales bacterium]|nr:DinB family protein [Longimicrobiales bacterium]
MAYTGRPAAGEFSAFYTGYVARVPAGDIVAILRDQLADTLSLFEPLAEADAERPYAEGKWTLKQMLGHLADTERVMAYRALRIARGDTTPLPGFDENDYARAAGSDARSVDDLRNELVTTRAATVALLAGLPATAWERTGTASEATVSVRAMACIIAGHELHHRAIIRTRYLDMEA